MVDQKNLSPTLRTKIIAKCGNKLVLASLCISQSHMEGECIASHILNLYTGIQYHAPPFLHGEKGSRFPFKRGLYGPRGPGSVVGIATGYGPEGPGIGSRWG